jgi:hypothetical protein
LSGQKVDKNTEVPSFELPKSHKEHNDAPSSLCFFAEETKMKKANEHTKAVRRRRQCFPRGWGEKRVRDLIAYHDRQTEDEEGAEYETATKLDGLTVMLVPNKLFPRSES